MTDDTLIFQHDRFSDSGDASSIQTSIPGRTPNACTHSSSGKFGMKAISQMLGHGCDNSVALGNLNYITRDERSGIAVDMAKRGVMVEFSNMSEFFVGFQVVSGKPPDHVFMAGASTYFADGGSRTFTPAPTP